jgi:hypothetical protein
MGFVRAKIMARCGECVGMNDKLAVWRFGFSPGSEAARAYGLFIDKGEEVSPGFMWVLATRKTGVVKDTFFGYAIELPAKFRKVIDE